MQFKGLCLKNIIKTLHKRQRHYTMYNNTMSLDNDFTNCLVNKSLLTQKSTLNSALYKMSQHEFYIQQ